MIFLFHFSEVAKIEGSKVGVRAAFKEECKTAPLIHIRYFVNKGMPPRQNFDEISRGPQKGYRGLDPVA